LQTVKPDTITISVVISAAIAKVRKDNKVQKTVFLNLRFMKLKMGRALSAPIFFKEVIKSSK
jgi:hypothetical protein